MQAVNNEFEQAVLGALMVTRDAINEIPDLRPEHFGSPDNREIFEVILQLMNDNGVIDSLTVSSKLKKCSPSVVMQITMKMSSAAHIKYHCAIIFENYLKREINRICQESIANIFEPGTDVFKIQHNIVSSLESMNIRTKRDFERIDRSFIAAIKKIESIQMSGKSLAGIDTGFRNMNEISHGLHGPDLVVIAARPSTGKTAFALNLAVNIAKSKIPVAFFSLEMSTEQLTMRVISTESGVYQNYITKANVSDSGWAAIMRTDFDMPLYIDDTPGLNLMDFTEKIRRAKRLFNIQVAFVDYLQLMTAFVKGNRELEIATIARKLKNTAKELNIPIIAMAQLSREVEKGKREPILSDLRESGEIEQAADIIMFLHNTGDIYDEVPNIKVMYAKHRNGPTGYIEFMFEKSRQKFKEKILC